MGDNINSLFVSPLWPQIQTVQPVKKGKLYLQSCGFFTRWHERFFVLTNQYLQFYKMNKSDGCKKLTSMGEHLFQLKLTELTDIEMIHRNDGLTVFVIEFQDSTRRYIKGETPQETRDWFSTLDNTVSLAKKGQKRKN